MQTMSDECFIKHLKDKHHISLNEGQEECVLTVKGAVLTIAVPGAGKTFSICARLYNMIWNYKIPCSKILAVTFSKGSAKDMDKKFSEVFGSTLENDIPNYSDNPMKFSTIHAFAYKILRDYERKYNVKFELIESSKNISKRAVFETIYKTFCSDSLTDDVYEELVRQISYCKNKLLSLDNIKSLSGEIHHKFYDIYIAYEDYKKNNGYIDFDDMLTLSLEYLKDIPEFYYKYSNMYDYIVVDEGQDTSTVQFKIIQIIAGKKANICVVGDDDQSIYEWRSADVDNFLYFDKYFPNVKKIFMEQNYRSTNKIIKVSNDFIKSNKKRYEKELFTENEEGSNLNIIECDSYDAEMEFIVNELRNIQNYKDHSIIYRNNVSAFTISNILAKNNIPFYIRDYKENFFTHWILNDILNFLNVAMYPKNIDSFTKIAFKMKRYISGKMLYFISKDTDDELDVFGKLLKYPDLKKFQKDQFITLRQEFARLKNKHTKFAIDYICNDFGYFEHLEQMSENLGFSLDSLKERIFILKELSCSCEDIYDFEDKLYEFKDTLDNAKSNYGKNAVVLTTCHSSKGLEWENVYMVDLNEGVFPSYKAIANAKEGDYDLLESERRLYYVGMTRAKQKLFLTHSKIRNGSFVNPSSFTKDVVEIAERFGCCDIKNFSTHKEVNNVSLFNLSKEKFIQNISENTLSDSNTNKKRTNRKSKNTNQTSMTLKPDTNVPFSTGKKVKHITLGEGIVVKNKNPFVEVRFSTGELKKLNIEICLKKHLLEEIS